MKRTLATYAIAAILILVGVSIMAYKHLALEFPLSPKQSFNSWYVEVAVNTESDRSYQRRRGREAAVELRLLKPQDNANYAVANMQMIERDYGTSHKKRGDLRYYLLSKRGVSRASSLLMRFNLYELVANETANDKTIAPDGRFATANRPANPDGTTQLLYVSIDELVSAARSHSSSSTSFAEQLARRLQANPELRSFLMQGTQSQDLTALVSTLLGSDGVATRIANGFFLSQASRNQPIERWLEVYDTNDGWQRVDVSRANAEETRDLSRYFTYWYGDAPLVNTQNIQRVNANISLKAETDGAFMRALWLSEQRNSFAHHIALQSLPLQQQMVVQILLLLPLGALMVAFFRQVIGVQTFGTFMPVLIALAFRETGLLYGLLFFIGVILIGITARHYIDRLQLLMVPRLSAVLTVVVTLIVLFMLANQESTIPLGISVALFPVVVITMFIERMSTILDEQGSQAAAMGYLGSMLVACIVYLSVMIESVQYVLFAFPELLLIILALCLMLGRYNGYKLSEYWRFRHLARQLGKK